MDVSTPLTNNIYLHGEDSVHKNDCGKSIKHKIERFFSIKTLTRVLPCLKWIPEYSPKLIPGDVIAGLTVGLLIVPQSLAFGLLAGLAPSTGLYTGLAGCVVYFFFGPTKELNIGPTVLMSLMTFHYTSQGGTDYAVFLCFIVGAIQVLAGVLNLGFMINFISKPVISGFMSAAAVTIASSQLKDIFGLKMQAKGLTETWYKLLANISDTRWQDLVLGLGCITCLMLLKEMRTLKSRCLESNSKRNKGWTEKTLFFLSISRNALIVLLAAIIALGLDGQNQPFTLIGEVTAGIPTPKIPPFSITINNVTMGTLEMLQDLGMGIVMVPFISVLSTIAVVSAISKGQPYDVSQEIIALGAINVAGAFFSSMPSSAALGRTAVNIFSGVNTPVGGLVTGTMILLSLEFLTPYFRFIPRASLAAVLICAVMHLFDYEILRPLWRSKRSDAITLGITFIACLFIGLEFGIILGIAINLLMMLFAIAKPPVHVTFITLHKTNSPAVLVTPTMGGFYPSTLHVRSAILKAGLKQGEGKLPVVVNCAHLATMDYTASEGLVGTVENFERRDQPIVFIKLQPQVKKVITSLKNIVSCESLQDVEESISETLAPIEIAPTESCLNNNGKEEQKKILF